MSALQPPVLGRRAAAAVAHARSTSVYTRPSDGQRFPRCRTKMQVDVSAIARQTSGTFQTLTQRRHFAEKKGGDKSASGAAVANRGGGQSGAPPANSQNFASGEYVSATKGPPAPSTPGVPGSSVNKRAWWKKLWNVPALRGTKDYGGEHVPLGRVFGWANPRKQNLTRKRRVQEVLQGQVDPRAQMEYAMKLQQNGNVVGGPTLLHHKGTAHMNHVLRANPAGEFCVTPAVFPTGSYRRARKNKFSAEKLQHWNGVGAWLPEETGSSAYGAPGSGVSSSSRQVPRHGGDMEVA